MISARGRWARGARWLVGMGVLGAGLGVAPPARATLTADGRFDVAVLNESSPDAAFWQESNLASVMSTAPGVAPFRLSYVAVGSLTDAGLASFDALVVASNLRWYATSAVSAAAARFVSRGGVLIIAPGTYLDSALNADPLMAGFGAGYELAWGQGDTVDTGCNGGAVWPAKVGFGPSPSDPVNSTPNALASVYTDCDHILLNHGGTSFHILAQTLQRTQANPATRALRYELMSATYGQGRILASATTFSHNTLQDQQLAENLILTAAVPAGAPPPDTVPPAVVLYPIPAMTGSPVLVVSGSAQDAGGVARVDVLLDGVVVASPTPSASGGSVQASITLPRGTSTVTLRATDVAGNQSSASGTVWFDDIAPVFHITSTTTITSDPRYLLTGTATDQGLGIGTVRLESNGITGAVPTPAADGSVSGYVTLTEGLNALTIEGIDAAGNYGQDRLLVTLDTTLPSARLLSVPALTNQAAIAITGSVSDAGGLASTTITLNGALLGTPTPAADGTVTVNGTLHPGSNTVVLRATDAAGNVSADSVDVVLDDAPPVVTVVTPLPGQAFGTSSVPLTLTVTDASPTTVDVDGQSAVFASGTGRFSTFITFGGNTLPQEGVNTITINARDAAGNAFTTTVDVLLDFTAPVLTTDCVDGTQLARQPGDLLLVTVHVDDLSATSVALGGATYALARGGGVLQAALPLQAGQNVLPITVTDEVGRSTTVARTVIYDVTPPQVSLLGPAAGAAVRGHVDLAIAASDALTGVARATVAIDGGAAVAMTAGNGSWLSTIDTRALADGAHTAGYSVTDAVGNTATLTSAFTVDNTAPTVSLTGLTAGAYVVGSATVTATAHDGGSGVAGVVLAVNGTTVARCATASCSGTVDTRALPDGPFQITATATDAAGNEATPAVQGQVALNNAPARFLVSPLQGTTVAGSMTVTVNVTSPYFASVDCSVDGVSLGVSTSPTFSKVVDLLATKLDGAVNVRCAARDLAGNVGVEQATVTLKNWNYTLNPRYLDQLYASTASTIIFSIDGPDPSIRQMIPWTNLGLTLQVPGGQPVPLSATTAPALYPHAPRLNVNFFFDRSALVAAIRAGVAAGKIDPTQSIPVQLVTRGRALGQDLMRAPTAPTPL